MTGTTVTPSVTRLEDESTVTSIVSVVDTSNSEKINEDDDHFHQADHHGDYTDEIERSRSRSSISSDGHLSLADSRILKAKDSSSSSSNIFHFTWYTLLVSPLLLTVQIFVYRFTFSLDNYYM